MSTMARPQNENCSPTPQNYAKPRESAAGNVVASVHPKLCGNRYRSIPQNLGKRCRKRSRECSPEIVRQPIPFNPTKPRESAAGNVVASVHPKLRRQTPFNPAKPRESAAGNAGKSVHPKLWRQQIPVNCAKPRKSAVGNAGESIHPKLCGNRYRSIPQNLGKRCREKIKRVRSPKIVRRQKDCREIVRCTDNTSCYPKRCVG